MLYLHNLEMMAMEYEECENCPIKDECDKVPEMICQYAVLGLLKTLSNAMKEWEEERKWEKHSRKVRNKNRG